MRLWIGIFRNKVILTVVGWKLINMINGNVNEIFGYCDHIESFIYMLVQAQKSLQIEKSWLSRPTFCKCSEFLDVFGKFGESGKSTKSGKSGKSGKFGESGKTGKYKMCSTNGMARHARLTVLA